MRPIKQFRPTWLNVARTVVQAGFVAFIAYVAVRHFIIGEATAGAVSVSPEAYCPFGGLETLYQFLSSGGQYLSHLHLSNLVLLAAVVLSALFAKSAFCGWICPFGTLQAWLYKAGAPLRRLPAVRAVSGRLARSPGAQRLDRVLRYAKYVVLAAVIGATVVDRTLIFRNWDPYATLINFGEISLTGGLVLLILTAVASLFTERAWCKYACPLGAIVGPVGRLSPLKVARNADLCTGCAVCTKHCPMGVKVHEAKVVGSADCNGCLACVAACPRPGALTPGVKPVNPLVFVALALVLFVGTIYASQGLGLWSTSGRVTASGETVVATGKDPAEIKGWMKIEEVLQAYEIPKDQFYAQFEIPEGFPVSSQLKDAEAAAPEFSLTALRDWITASRAAGH